MGKYGDKLRVNHNYVFQLLNIRSLKFMFFTFYSWLEIES